MIKRALKLLGGAVLAATFACSPNPPCTTGATDVRLKDANGATLFYADNACATWDSGALYVTFEVEHGDERITGANLLSRVTPQTVGTFSCEQSELGIYVNANIDGDRRYQYSDASYKAGNDPGSQLNGTSCTFDVTSAPPSGTMAGTLVGRLGRAPLSGDPEFVDFSFTFGIPLNEDQR